MDALRKSYHLEGDIVHLYGKCNTGADGSTRDLEGEGIYSIDEIAEGKYQIVLDYNFAHLLHFSAVTYEAGDTDVKPASLDSETVTTTKQVTFWFYQAGTDSTAKSPVSTTIYFQLKLLLSGDVS